MTDLAPDDDIWQEIQGPLFDQLTKLNESTHHLQRYAGKALVAPMVEQIDLCLDAMQAVFDQMKALATGADHRSQALEHRAEAAERKLEALAGGLASAVGSLDAKAQRSKAKTITFEHEYAGDVLRWYQAGADLTTMPQRG